MTSAEDTARDGLRPDHDGRADHDSRLVIAYRRFWEWAQRVHLETKVMVLLLVAAFGAGLATYMALTGTLIWAVDPESTLLLLNLDLVLVLLLGIMIMRRMVRLWMARRQGIAGARLHGRMALLFGLVAVMPASLVALLSVLFLNFALQGWFSEKVSTAIKESLEVARSYLQEHRSTILSDALAMARDINIEGPRLLDDQQLFDRYVTAQADIRGLTDAIVIEGTGRVLARSAFSLVFEFDLDIPQFALERARAGEAVILSSDSDDRVRALVRLENFVDTFLYVGRLVDLRVLSHMDRTRGAVQIYETLESEREGVEITFAMIFGVIALLLLAAAMWMGLYFATHLTRPIGRLIAASEQVGTGNLGVRVPEQDRGDELGVLSHSFNRMTAQLESQQAELVAANEELDERRRFTEAVLAGVTAGVVGLDESWRVDLPNRAACALLDTAAEDMMGRPLADVVPEMAPLILKAARGGRDVVQGQVEVSRHGRMLTLLVRVTVERTDAALTGFVVTFDDVTELMSAQRKAAWADVARRIAHEIKNPLTPIQLSAERLKRRYLKQISEDPDTFAACTDTIVRQVGAIGHLVDEFSNFARMPAPVMQEENLVALVRQAAVLQGEPHERIDVELRLPEEPVKVRCDGQQIGQAVINLVQNALQAVESRIARDGTSDGKDAGKVTVSVVSLDHEGAAEILVQDNGCGLPAQFRDRLTEPYITTKERGTGLGLAIVRKIMEDHGGELILDDAPSGGALVKLVFRRAPRRAG